MCRETIDTYIGEGFTLFWATVGPNNGLLIPFDFLCAERVTSNEDALGARLLIPHALQPRLLAKRLDDELCLANKAAHRGADIRPCSPESASAARTPVWLNSIKLLGKPAFAVAPKAVDVVVSTFGQGEGATAPWPTGTHRHPRSLGLLGASSRSARRCRPLRAAARRRAWAR